MRKEYLTVAVANIIVFIFGALLVINPSMGMTDVNFMFFVIMIFYGLVNYILYLITRKKDDYEYLFVSLVSIVVGTAGSVFNSENSAMVLSLSLMSWVAMMAIIKLIKIDYYHDRNNPLCFLRTITFVLFLIVGTLICVNLFYNIKIQSIMLGFLLISIAILDVFDPVVGIVMYLHQEKLEKEALKKEILKEMQAKKKKSIKLEKTDANKSTKKNSTKSKAKENKAN